MVEFVNVNIQNALITQVVNANLGPPIAFPFVPYAPVEDQAYIEIQPIMKAKTQHPGLGYADSNLSRGIFQVDAVIPDGIGEPAGLRLQAKIADLFRMGTNFVVGSFKLQINAPTQTTMGMKDGAWVRFPVSVTFTVITSDSDADFDSEFDSDYN